MVASSNCPDKLVHRTQLFLTGAQHRWLAREARARGTSIAQIVRELVDERAGGPTEGKDPLLAWAAEPAHRSPARSRGRGTPRPPGRST